MFGIIVYTIAIPILGKIECTKHMICHNNHMADASFGIRQILGNYLLLALCFVLIVDVSIFNSIGACITKHMSGLARTTIDILRMVVIWLVSFLLGWEEFKYLQVGC